MQSLKRTLKQALQATGYQILPANAGPAVRFDNFKNLSLAYEQLLSETPWSAPIEPNELRPKLLAQLLGTPPTEAYFIIQALAQVKQIAGDVCEFGVAQGATSALIANEIATTDRILHLFDSFQGLPKPSEKDALKDDIFALGTMEAYEGAMSCPEDMVVARLKSLSFPTNRYVLHKGFIEDIVRTDTTLPQRVAFAYIDFDFYEPILTVLALLDKIALAGALFVVDDYDFFSTGAKSAVDEFMSVQNGGRERYAISIPDTRFGHFALVKKLA